MASRPMRKNTEEEDLLALQREQEELQMLGLEDGTDEFGSGGLLMQ